MELRPVGPILDALDVNIPLGENDHAVQALVLLKVMNLETGEVNLTMAHNGLDWIERQGLISAAGMCVGSDLMDAMGVDEDEDE